ncbi:unnamed protein product [Cuscuta epithymum]|uniref:Ribosome maturation factor RimP N-terminal domain-containing protein n=1 Tax=Cuscuta epithymum TaxID=186058 RepID=A0AAV0EB75_9ASTE|nr:unnamed protein product [Cuscuta epithymum]CAH9131165.1 unnamed protein product [Cuscuta epithymum]
MRKTGFLFKTHAGKFSFSSCSAFCHCPHRLHPSVPVEPSFQNPSNVLQKFIKPGQNFAASLALRHLTTAHSEYKGDQSSRENCPINYDTSEEAEPIDYWEEEEEVEPEIGDGGDGGGVVFQNCHWGEKALSIANQVVKEHTVDMELYAFKTSPRGYIYVRLDKLTNEYGCPTMDEIEDFSHQYKKRLDEAGTVEDFPEDLALEVSSPGAERLLKVPDDLNRFKHMPMRVSYVEDGSHGLETNKIFFLDCINTDLGNCVWKLVDVKENRDPSAKGRPLNRKQKDWRLTLPYATMKRVTLFISS